MILNVAIYPNCETKQYNYDVLDFHRQLSLS